MITYFIIAESAVIAILAIALTVFIILFIRRDRTLRRYLFHSQPINYNHNDNDVKLIMSLKAKMEKERVFTDSKINLDRIAKMLGTNRSTLSKAINTGLGVNFSTFLNSYRIREAIRLLNDNSAQSYKMESIGRLCGFNSRQAFHRAFKNETGMNMRQYTKQMSNYKL
ncbi:MAG: AraC family transcriptional regulator [Bacteroidaceae bacterium]|nr:AraC family transcriptional regulator [Bacteroidaceae bacterium]